MDQEIEEQAAGKALTSEDVLRLIRGNGRPKGSRRYLTIFLTDDLLEPVEQIE